MIELVTVQAYKCSHCGWQWFNRKDGIAPKRCPRRSCRKLAGYVEVKAKPITKPKVWLKTSDALRAMRER